MAQASFNVGSPGSISIGVGGLLYAYNTLDAVTPVAVAPANAARSRLTFHNPGDVDVIVYPALKQNSGSDAANAPTIAAKGGSFLIYANGGSLTLEGGNLGYAWSALAASGSGKPLTVLDQVS